MRDDPRVRADLEAILAGQPAPPGGTGRIDTWSVLAELARAWPQPLDGESLGHWQALCRKVHVAGKVLATYRRGWRRPRAAEPLPPPAWPLLIAVLLAYAVPSGDGEAERGLALKSLNAALAARDLARQGGGESSPVDLGAWSERALAALLEEAERES